MNRQIIAFVLLSQVGCAGLEPLTSGWFKASNPPPAESARPVPSYTEKVQSYLGYSIETVVNQAGYPTRTFRAPNGNMVHAWEQSTSGQTSTWTAPGFTSVTDMGYGNVSAVHFPGATYGGQTVVYTCNTYFEVDANQTIVKGTWQGNSCR